MQKSIIALAISTLILPATAHAADVYKSGKTTAAIGGYLEMNLTQSDGDTNMDDLNSRINFSYTQELTEGWSAFGFVEWRLNLVDNTDSIGFSQGGDSFASSADDFNNTVTLRHGQIGVNHDKWGTIKIGKQWSAYYDVTSSTDVLMVWGGNASGTFNYGTDGGQSGTGRAEKAITYRNNWGDFYLALQYQAKSGTETDIYECQQDPNIDCDPDNLGPVVTSIEYDYGAGGSITYQTPWDISLGIGYNRSEITNSPNVAGFNDDYEDVVAVGAVYGAYNAPINVAINYNWGENHEFDDEGTVFDSEGLEIYGHYMPTAHWRLYAAYNYLREAGDDAGYDGDFEIKYLALGAQYIWTETFILYTENKFEDSSFTSDKDPDNIYSIGVRYYY
ncbi:porin [Corallincola luteus]|uniref:Porin n=1 Tax=Corallincola luteus TaxID=1775177 RepID=A0ABY2AJT6_9GAMM|nr:porin [Corallincola luteus]TCI01559.1 porin [Corallincola luteus]